jgi:hypothetical protein
MKNTKKLINTAMVLAIGLFTLANLSAMESPEQRAEEIRLHRLRQQQEQAEWQRMQEERQRSSRRQVQQQQQQNRQYQGQQPRQQMQHSRSIFAQKPQRQPMRQSINQPIQQQRQSQTVQPQPMHQSINQSIQQQRINQPNFHEQQPFQVYQPQLQPQQQKLPELATNQSEIIKALLQCQEILQQTQLQIEQLQNLPEMNLDLPTKELMQKRETIQSEMRRQLQSQQIQRLLLQAQLQNLKGTPRIPQLAQEIGELREQQRRVGPLNVDLKRLNALVTEQRLLLGKQKLQKNNYNSQQGQPAKQLVTPQVQEQRKNQQQKTQLQLDQLQVQLQNQEQNLQQKNARNRGQQQEKLMDKAILETWKKQLQQLHQSVLEELELIQNQLVQLEPQKLIQQEEKACIICMEEQDICSIPCKNKHNDPICKSCLADIKNKTNLCPMCREPLLK